MASSGTMASLGTDDEDDYGKILRNDLHKSIATQHFEQGLGVLYDLVIAIRECPINRNIKSMVDQLYGHFKRAEENCHKIRDNYKKNIYDVLLLRKDTEEQIVRSKRSLSCLNNQLQEKETGQKLLKDQIERGEKELSEKLSAARSSRLEHQEAPISVFGYFVTAAFFSSLTFFTGGSAALVLAAPAMAGIASVTKLQQTKENLKNANKMAWDCEIELYGVKKEKKETENKIRDLTDKLAQIKIDQNVAKKGLDEIMSRLQFITKVVFHLTNFKHEFNYLLSTIEVLQETEMNEDHRKQLFMLVCRIIENVLDGPNQQILGLPVCTRLQEFARNYRTNLQTGYVSGATQKPRKQTIKSVDSNTSELYI